MTINKTKIRCPKCATVYAIDNSQTNIIGKKAAKCIICDSRFFVENQEVQKNSDQTRSGVTFLQSYFEKRGGLARRKVSDRRKDIDMEDLSLSEFTHDIIPIFNNEGKIIIGHISPGRRQGADRRRGIERRRYSTDQDSPGPEAISEDKFDILRDVVSQ
jgi:predicted Zn finger-like uncharacterized protein